MNNRQQKNVAASSDEWYTPRWIKDTLGPLFRKEYERGRHDMLKELSMEANDGYIVNDDGTHKLIVPSLPIITRNMDDGDRVKILIIKKHLL